MQTPNSIGRRCIVVLGMHRSGTSAAAGCMSLLGMQPGDDLLPANEYNAKGYWERANVVRLHDELLTELGSSWLDIRMLPPDWLHHPATQRARLALKELLAAELTRGGIPMFKDPRMCRLMPMWLGIFQEVDVTPLFLCMVRHPQEVVASLRARDAILKDDALLLWLQHNIEAERHTRQYQRTLITYESLLATPDAVLRNVADALSLTMPLDDEALQVRMTEFLDSNLRHTRYASSACPADTPQAWAEALYQQFASGSADAQFCNAAGSRLRRHLVALAHWSSEAVRNVRSPRSVLYWCTASSPAFSEAMTVSQPVGILNEVLDLEFEIPADVHDIMGLRFDIIDRPAVAEISALRWLDAVGETAWQWQGSLEELVSGSADIASIRPSAEGLHIVARDHDPYLHVRVPQTVLARIASGWRMQVEMRAIPLESDTLPAGILPQTETLRAYLEHDTGVALHCKVRRSDLHTLSARQAAQDELLAQQRQELEECQQRLRLCQDEITRIEGQLDLLKSLFSHSIESSAQL